MSLNSFNNMNRLSQANRRRSKSVEDINYNPNEVTNNLSRTRSSQQVTSLEIASFPDLVYRHLFLFSKLDKPVVVELTGSRSRGNTRGAIAIDDDDEQFLLIYPSFSTPKDLLELLIAKWREIDTDKPKPKGFLPSVLNRGSLHTFEEKKSRISEVLSLWIRSHPIDFYKRENGQLVLDSSLSDTLKKFLNKEVKTYSSKCHQEITKIIEEKLPKIMEQSILVKQQKQSNPLAPINRATATPETLWKAESLLNLKDAAANSILDFHPEEIARQLCLLEYQYLHGIDTREFLNGNWMKNKSPNVQLMIDQFNRISKFVILEIVKVKNMEQRVAVLSHFVSIADKCRQMGNFESVLEIMAGLSNSCISRLSQTWALLSPKILNTYQELEKFTSTSLNFKELRATIESISGPCIPYLGMYLSDLTFIDEGNSSTVDGYINYSKWQQTAKVLQKIIKFQQKPFSYAPLELLQSFFEKRLLITEDEKILYNMSLECQARGAEINPHRTVRQSTISNFKKVKDLVETKGKRFQKGVGFTVNVTYIADRILIMGYPSRFKLPKYVSFLDETHKGHYKIFNLSEENSYSSTRAWRNKVSYYPIQRHSVPLLDVVDSFLTDINEWLDQNPLNVAAVHCKGKSRDRSLLMICFWLLKSRKCYAVTHSIQHCNAVCNYQETPFYPSQIRYLNYMETMINKKEIPNKSRTLLLDKVIFYTVPTFEKGSCEPFFSIECQGRQIFRSRRKLEDPKMTTVEFQCSQVVRGDVKIHFYHQTVETPMFSACFHLSFVQGSKVRLMKRDLDYAHLDVQNKLFHKDFRVEISLKKVKAAKAPDMKLSEILVDKDYNNALKEFMTNNGGVEKLEMLNDTEEFERIPSTDSTMLKTKGKALLSRHRDVIKEETEQEIIQALSNPTPQLFKKAKVEVYHEIETEQLPKFLISDTYNNVADNNSESASSFSTFETNLDDENTPKGTCAHCLKPIINLEDSLTVGDFKYHLDCLHCAKCNKKVDSKVCIIKDRQIYCADCEGQKLFSRCFKCNDTITDKDHESITVKGELLSYHRNCFRCSKCQDSTKRLEFWAGNLYCEEHIHDVDQPSNITPEEPLPVNDEIPELEEEKIPEPIPEPEKLPEPVLEKLPEQIPEPKQEKPPTQQLVKTQIEEKQEKIVINCSVCNKPVGNEFLKAMGKSFHPNCFTCNICNVPTKEFVYYNEKLYCKQHSHLAGKQIVCKGCENPIIRGTQMLIVENYRFHVDCFKCHNCHCPMTEYCEHDNQFYCITCVNIIRRRQQQQPSLLQSSNSSNGSWLNSSSSSSNLFLNNNNNNNNNKNDEKLIELSMKTTSLLDNIIAQVISLKNKVRSTNSLSDLMDCGKIAKQLKLELANFVYSNPTSESPFEEKEKLRFLIGHTLQFAHDSCLLLRVQISQQSDLEKLIEPVRQVQRIAKIIL